MRLQIDGREDLRHYSLIDPVMAVADTQQMPALAGCYRIAVKRADPGRGGSRQMWALSPGDTLPVAGPDNHFALPVAAPHTLHTLLVAGGIGITPLVGMALALAARGAPLRMLYAAGSATELVFGAELRAALGDRLQTFADDEGQRIDLAAEISALPPRAQLLICVSVPLLQAAQVEWARSGRAAADLRFETFGSSGHRAPEVDHRDVFFSADEKAHNTQLCGCVSAGLIVLLKNTLHGKGVRALMQRPPARSWSASIPSDSIR